MKPTIITDEAGVWRENQPGKRSGYSWDEVYSVSGHKADGVDELNIVVVFDTEYGEFMECYSHWDGFAELVNSLATHLPDFPADWFAQIEELDEESVAKIWTRAG